MSLSNKKIFLIAISIFTLLLSIALYVDIQNGVFDKKTTKIKAYNIKSTPYRHRNNTYRQVSTTKRNSLKPITAKSRKLTNEEIMLSRIKTTYLRYIEYSLRLNWKNPTGDNTLTSAYTIFIKPNGSVSGYCPLRTSNDEFFNDTAIMTIAKTVPFHPIPEAFNKPDGIALQVFFNGEEVQAGAISSQNDNTSYPLPYNKTVITTPEISNTKDLRIQSRIDSKYVSHFNLYKQVQTNWAPPLDRNSSVTANFKLYKDGSIQNLEIEESTGDKEAESAALKAVKAIKLNSYKDFDERGFVNVNYRFEVVDNI